MKPAIPANTVERLSLYRRLLEAWLEKGTTSLYSHQIATMACVTPAQVRRDLMAIGYTGSPSKGYSVDALEESIALFLGSDRVRKIALVGMGNLGRALTTYFTSRVPRFRMAAAFDTDTRKTGRVIAGCMVYGIEEIPRIIPAEGIRTAAQEIADRLVNAGIKGILNYAPVPLRLPADVFLENRDVTASLEKVAFFSGQPREGS
jgi:redox-sensing transcriptional repressor